MGSLIAVEMWISYPHLLKVVGGVGKLSPTRKLDEWKEPAQG